MKKDLENMEVLAKKVAEQSSKNLKTSVEGLLDGVKVLCNSCTNDRQINPWNTPIKDIYTYGIRNLYQDGINHLMN